ncbi:hypothetical protein GOODEAATRI_021822, partial [Goodea atripinnis]
SISVEVLCVADSLPFNFRFIMCQFGPGCSMTPQSCSAVKVVLQSEDGVQLSCMFCDQIFLNQDELGPHVLTHHPTTLYEPTVLRVDAEFRIPGERSRPKPGSLPVQKEEVPSCIVCGHIAQDANELETHMRKHKDYFTYCCSICGRRFRESWFLKNHMKMHVKPGPKSKAVLDQEAPFTINDVTQEPPLEPVVSVYKMCMVCGFFFPDHDSLAEHSKVHNREAELGKEEVKEKMNGATESLAKQEAFLGSLNLQPGSTNKSLNSARSSKWISQLDPFTTYQAWQLATKGKIAVGPNNTKDIGQELSTDNEDCGSDKDEMSIIWSESQGDKTVKEVLGRELRSQQQAVAETSNPPRRSLMQKHKDKERPTTCEECQKTFRTYHQLVLHSRIHKRERGGEDSPTSAEVKIPRTISQDPAEEGHEEALEENLISGCPPALDGKDVAPLQMTDRPHPRRTKSPLSRPSKHEEGLPVNLPHGQKRSSVHAAGQAVVHYKQNTESQPNREYSRYTEVMKKTSAGSKYIMDRAAPLDRVGIGERSYPSRSGAIWNSDAARLCLSSRFGTLPQMDFGDPSGKRLKFSASTNREVETGEKMSLRAPPVDGPNRLLIQVRNVKPGSQGSGPSSASEALCPIKTGSAPLGGSLESDWSMMNFLPYTPSDLASLYHSTPTNPSHGALANPRAGMY